MESRGTRGTPAADEGDLGEEAQGGGTTALVSARPAGVLVAPGRVIEAEASAVGELDAAIARRREELAVLERAKAIVLGE